MHLTLSWLYGILFIASVFITAAMWRMGRDRLDEREVRVVARPDLYFMVVFYAGLHGLGGAIWWALRAWDAVINDRMNVGTAPILIIIAAVLYAVGKGGLVFASSVNGKPFIWRVFLAACALWSVVIWWEVFAHF